MSQGQHLAVTFSMRSLFILLVSLIISIPLSGRHLVGGELTYRCLGDVGGGMSRFEVALSLYRDCEGDAASIPFDPDITLYVFDGLLLDSVLAVTIPLMDSTQIPIIGSDTCVAPPTGLCYLQTVYRAEIDLPNNLNGYHISWARCCRNQSIINLVDPGDEGLIFSTFIPSTSFCNNSPTFNQTLPTFICVNENFQFDLSATDVDGDSLAYRLQSPYTAGDRNDPVPIPIPPPFQTVNWLPPFNAGNMMGGTVPLQIDNQTGLLQVQPNQLGQYVFGVTVEEYRNGNLISEITRDIQVNVIDCPINFPPQVQRASGGSDTLGFYAGEMACYDFSITDNNGQGAGVDQLTISARGDILGGGALSPPFASFNATNGTSPITADLCWQPACDSIGNVYPIFIQVSDDNNCPGPNVARDTFYLEILPPRAEPPVLNCVSVVGPNQIELNWTALPELDGHLGFSFYTIERNDGTGWRPISLISHATQNNYTDFSAINNDATSYCYRIRTTLRCPGNIQSQPGNEMCSITVQATQLGPSLSQINWDAADLNQPTYTLMADSMGNIITIATGLTDTLFDFVSCSFSGSFYVIAADSANTCQMRSGNSNLVVHTDSIPPIPNLCGVSYVNQNTIEINWESVGISDFYRYQVLRSEPGSGTFSPVFESMDSTILSFVDSTISPGQGPYCYQVLVEDICGSTNISEADCGVSLQATLLDQEVQLDWSAYVGWLGDVASYEIFNINDPNNPISLGTVPGSTYTFTDQSVQSSQSTYCYQIVATPQQLDCLPMSFSNSVCVNFPSTIYVPNAFTPNADGFNEFWRIQGTFIQTFSVRIYSRWGEVIFESNDIDRSWDGTDNGRQAPEGVYVYLLKVTDTSGEAYERGGTVTLIR